MRLKTTYRKVTKFQAPTETTDSLKARCAPLQAVEYSGDLMNAYGPDLTLGSHADGSTNGGNRGMTAFTGGIFERLRTQEPDMPGHTRAKL